MKNKKIRATFYGIPCWYTIKDNGLEGRNKLYDILLEMATGFHQLCNFLLNKNNPFPIKIDKRDITKKELIKLNKRTEEELHNLRNIL